MDAFAEARRRGVTHELVCVGPYGWSSRDLYTHIDRLGLRRVVHFTGYVPVEDLPVIYNLAEVFVFPSIYEGFGLPVVEAMACGTPVITAASSSLEEIAAGAAEMIDPAQTEPLADAIVRLSRDGYRREHLAQQGLLRAREFSWARTAREMVGIYSRAAGFAVSTPAVQAAAEVDTAMPVKSVSRGVMS